MQTSTETAAPLASQALPAELPQRVILPGVSWEAYQRLLADFLDSHAAHFAYDRGRLEIMVLSAEHEEDKDVLTLLVNVLAEELGIDVRSFGSTTFQREDLDRGFEPDACFYIAHEALVRGKKKLDLAVDPPPDLVIDITSPSLNKFPIFTALRIPEVWRYDGVRLAIFSLEEDSYVERKESVALPKVTSGVLSEFIEKSKQMKRTAWLRQVREWVRKPQS
jgi:Uma2 family endonuclease